MTLPGLDESVWSPCLLEHAIFSPGTHGQSLDKFGTHFHNLPQWLSTVSKIASRVHSGSILTTPLSITLLSITKHKDGRLTKFNPLSLSVSLLSTTMSKGGRLIYVCIVYRRSVTSDTPRHAKTSFYCLPTHGHFTPSIENQKSTRRKP